MWPVSENPSGRCANPRRGLIELAVAMRLPSGENDAENALFSCPARVVGSAAALDLADARRAIRPG